MKNFIKRYYKYGVIVVVVAVLAIVGLVKLPQYSAHAEITVGAYAQLTGITPNPASSQIIVTGVENNGMQPNYGTGCGPSGSYALPGQLAEDMNPMQFFIDGMPVGGSISTSTFKEGTKIGTCVPSGSSWSDTVYDFTVTLNGISSLSNGTHTLALCVLSSGAFGITANSSYQTCGFSSQSGVQMNSLPFTVENLGTLNVDSTNIVTGAPVVGSWSAFGPTNESSTNAVAASYTNIPLTGGTATYTITPRNAPGFAMGGVEKIGVARASNASVFANAFAMIHNAFTSVALADGSQMVGADVCVSSTTFDASLGRYTCKGADGGSDEFSSSLTLTTDQPVGNATIIWWPLAAMNVTPATVALDKFGNGQITVQNSGSSGSELDWNANTTSTWFTLGSGTGAVVNNASQHDASGATQAIAISIPNASTLAGNYTGMVQVVGVSKYCPNDGTKVDCSMPKLVVVTFTGTCTGSGCHVCTSPDPDCTPIIDHFNSVPTINISPASSTIPLGQSQDLTITSAGADSCVQSGAWSGAKCSGVITVTPNASGTFTYKIKATNSLGSAISSATVTAQDANGCPGSACNQSSTQPQNYAPSCSLIASPTSIIVPASSTLSYYCTNVQSGSCTLSGGGFGSSSGITVKGTTAQGTTSDAPSKNTFYVINCSGTDTYSGTTVSANAEVVVTNPGRSETNP